LDYVTFNALSKTPVNVLELDVHVRPAEPASHILALFESES